MASRLYRTTRRLYIQVAHLLAQLGIVDLGSPTTAVLIALYVTGLILLDVHQTQTRVTRFLPGRCHDALNRLLRVMPLSTRALMSLLVNWVKRQPLGYLCLDDVVVEKAWAKRLPWAGWTYSFAKKRKVYGLHIVVLLWCSQDHRWRIPVAFRLWRPKRSVAKRDYRTKLQLAEVMLKEVVAAGLQCQYIVFDTQYTAGWFAKMVGRLGLVWQGTLGPRTNVVWRGQKQAVSKLAPTLRLKWRKALGLRAVALEVYAPKFGVLQLVVTRNRHGNYEYIVSNDLSADLTTIVLRKRSRWSVETIFRDTKQFAGLEACQCWADQAMVRHVGLVLLTFVVLQMLRVHSQESVGAVKERWQLEVARDSELPPAPLKACPTHLRLTA
jgi:DDE superfamily endonuclease